ncbi:MAG TPA: mechanosensitive ion channel domain-containing protein [Pyrinomonadaceae bacterium]
MQMLLLWQTGADGWGRIWSYLHIATRKFEIGNFTISLVTLFIAVLVLFVAFTLSRVLRSFLTPRLAARTHLDPGVQYTILRLTHYVIITVGVLTALKIGLNADFTSLAVVFTALSVGIGFGLQYIANDIASGFILLFERPVRIGDFVTVGEIDSRIIEGRVTYINLRTTVVMTNDRIAIIVPNSKLVSDRLINWSYADKRSRISIPLGVSSGADPNLVTEVLLRAAEGVEYVLTDPKPSVLFDGFGDFTLDFRLLVCTDRPRRYRKIKSDINYRIWQLCKEANIEIPDPRRELTLRGGALDVRLRRPDLPMDDAGPDDTTGDEETGQRAQLTH